jgi:hypothetical protein
MTRVIESVSGEVLVNTETGSWQYTPVVAALPSGGFVMAWGDDSGMGGDAEASSIKAQVFDADGNKLGGEILVNTAPAQGQYAPAIAALPDGGFVVT